MTNIYVSINITIDSCDCFINSLSQMNLPDRKLSWSFATDFTDFNLVCNCNSSFDFVKMDGNDNVKGSVLGFYTCIM